MTVTIELSEDQAAVLKVQAEALGLTVERWLEQIAAQVAPSTSIAHMQLTNPKEWARRFHEWAEGHDRTTPLLSDQAISRESIYPDRV
jgi:hypothetical protein